METIKFNQEPNVFSKGMHLTGSLIMDVDLSDIKKRLCSTCLNEISKNNCKLLGKIKYPDREHCSWWKRK